MTPLQRQSHRTARTAAVVALLAWCVVPATADAATPRTVCVPFSDSGVGQDLGGGRTVGVLSVEGDRIGTTSATFALGAGGAFTGPLVFVPDRVAGSTLTAELAGTFDATGAFSATSTSLRGKGQLQLVSGSLAVQGVERADGSFTETLVGELCTLSSRVRVIERIVG